MTDKTAPDTEPTDLPTALIELRHARTEIDRLRPFADMVDQAQRDAEAAEQTGPLLALAAREKTTRDHTLNLHVIGEQLSEIETWFWQHLADVREAARKQTGGPLPDDVAQAPEHEPEDLTGAGTPEHGCTIGGLPAMPILVSEHQQLTARAASAEAALVRVRKLAEFARDRVAPGRDSTSRAQHDLACAVLDVLGEPPSPAATEATEPADLTGYLASDCSPTAPETEPNNPDGDGTPANEAEAALARVQALIDEHPVAVGTHLLEEALDTPKEQR